MRSCHVGGYQCDDVEADLTSDMAIDDTLEDDDEDAASISVGTDSAFVWCAGYSTAELSGNGSSKVEPLVAGSDDPDDEDVDAEPAIDVEYTAPRLLRYFSIFSLSCSFKLLDILLAALVSHFSALFRSCLNP